MLPHRRRQGGERQEEKEALSVPAVAGLSEGEGRWLWLRRQPPMRVKGIVAGLSGEDRRWEGSKSDLGFGPGG